MWYFFFGIMTVYCVHLQNCTLTNLFTAASDFYACFLLQFACIFKEYTQWGPFRDLQKNFIQLSIRQMKVENGKIEVKNSLVWV